VHVPTRHRQARSCAALRSRLAHLALAFMHLRSRWPVPTPCRLHWDLLDRLFPMLLPRLTPGEAAELAHALGRQLPGDASAPAAAGAANSTGSSGDGGGGRFRIHFKPKAAAEAVSGGDSDGSEQEDGQVGRSWSLPGCGACSACSAGRTGGCYARCCGCRAEQPASTTLAAALLAVLCRSGSSWASRTGSSQ
jgi:hypothetical protein